MLFQKCKNCGSKFTYKTLIEPLWKDRSSINCSNCGAAHRTTWTSRNFLNILMFGPMIFGGFQILRFNLLLGILAYVAYILLLVVLSPLIYRYRLIEKKSLIGYIKINYDHIYIDEIEVVEVEDKKRISELNLDECDMKNGYVLVKQDKEEETLYLANKVVFTFTDLSGELLGNREDGNLYTTSMRYEFTEHLKDLKENTYRDEEIPYFIEVEDDEVVSLVEAVQYVF